MLLVKLIFPVARDSGNVALAATMLCKGRSPSCVMVCGIMGTDGKLYRLKRQCDLEGDLFIRTKRQLAQPPDKNKYPGRISKDRDTDFR